MRADLLLPLMFGIAITWPPLASLSWAFIWGFAVDTLSGKFWGFHVGSYVVAVCLVNVASEKFELQNPLYQMLLVGIGAFGQSLSLCLFLLLEPYTMVDLSSIWKELIIRSFFIMLFSPFVIYPIRNVRGVLFN
jgi:rod shape-determining protein MreD